MSQGWHVIVIRSLGGQSCVVEPLAFELGGTWGVCSLNWRRAVGAVGAVRLVSVSFRCRFDAVSKVEDLSNTLASWRELHHLHATKRPAQAHRVLQLNDTKTMFTTIDLSPHHSRPHEKKKRADFVVVGKPYVLPQVSVRSSIHTRVFELLHF